MNISDPKKCERYRFVDVNETDRLESYFSQDFVLFERAVYHPAHQTFYQTLIKYEPAIIRQPLSLTAREKTCLQHLQTKKRCTYKHLARYMSCGERNIHDILTKLRKKVGASTTPDIIKRLYLYEIK